MRRRRFFRNLFFVVFGLSGLAFLWGLFLWLSVPDVASLAGGFPERTSYMRLRAAGLERSADSFRVEPTEVLTAAPLLACAMVKSEDLLFFDHGGINWHQHWWTLTTRFTLTGTSSLTQQLARNLYLGPERTLSRKLREMFITRELERALSKYRILELYLNVIEWGDGVWGAGPAARHYFDKSPGALDAFEASFLSALTAAPRRPLEGRNLERAAGVQRRVLMQLYSSGIIDEAAWRHADTRAGSVFGCLREKRPLAAAMACTRAAARSEAPAPFVARRVEAPLQDWLGQRCGLERELAEY